MMGLSLAFSVAWIAAIVLSLWNISALVRSLLNVGSASHQFWWNWWVQAAVAVGTIGAVFVAIFGKPIRSKCFQPRLEVALKNEVGERTPRTIGRLPDGQWRFEESPYYHLRVSNERGDWAPAKEVEVILVGIEDVDGRLIWEGEVPMRWRNQEFVAHTRRIGPDGDCDLCCVGAESGFSLLVRLPLTSLTTTATSGVNTQNVKEGFTIVARLQVRCSNQVRPVTFRFRLAWSGRWARADDEMRQNMVITQLASLPAVEQ